jgi:hypothetical protein
MGWIVLAMVIALQSAAPPPAQQRADSRTWYQAYTDGRRAFEQGNWQAAIDSLEASTRADGAPKPGRRVPFYGDVYDDYLPDYYLGLAYLNLKQYAAADRALDAMRASGVIGPSDREYAQLDQQSRAAKAALQAANNPVQQQTPRTTAPGNAANTNAPPPVVTAPRDSPNSNANAPATPVETQAGNRVTVPPVAQGPAATNSRATAKPPAGSNGPGKALPNAPNIARQTRAAVTPGGARAISQADELAAVAAYFNGQYDEADRLLAAAASGGASPRALFYLTCSRAALIILGRGDRDAFRQARQALTSAGGAATFAADRRYISPRVLQMIEGTP